MEWAVVRCDIRTYWDGAEISTEIVAERSEDVAPYDAVEALEVRAASWTAMTSAGEVFTANTFAAFLEGLAARSVRWAFTFDGIRVFHMADVARIFDCGGRFKTITNERSSETGQYAARGEEGFMERSGDNGQRWDMTFWVRAKKLGGNRHKRVRPVTFSNLDEILVAGRDAAAESFGVDDPGIAGDYMIVSAFNDVCAGLGHAMIEKKRMGFIAVGGLAKSVLLDYIGAKRMRAACALTPAQFTYLWRGKIMRGGGVIINDAFRGRIIGPVWGYDVNSEYLRVFSESAELTTLERCTFDDYLNDDTEKYEYLITFDRLVLRLRDGEIPCAKGRDGETIRGGVVCGSDRRMTFFAPEIEEIQNHYDIVEMHVHSVLRSYKRYNPGFENFAADLYGMKSAATESGDGGMRMVVKMIINSALGKLAQKSVWPKTEHIARGVQPRMVHAQTTLPDPDESARECGALAYVQGAYVTALARVYHMRMIHAVCNGRRPCDVIVYGDTDSIYATVPAPHVVGGGLGECKCEINGGKIRVIAPKTYIAWDDQRINIHATGVRRNDLIRDALRAGVNVQNGAAIAEYMSAARVIHSTINVVVPGGRADIRIPRRLCADGRPFIDDETRFGRGKNALLEL